MTATLICPLTNPVDGTCAVVDVVAGGCNAVQKLINSRKRMMIVKALVVVWLKVPNGDKNEKGLEPKTHGAVYRGLVPEPRSHVLF